MVARSLPISPEWLQKYGEHCLNSDAEVTTLAEFCERKSFLFTDYFLRPCKDLKLFSGDVISVDQIHEWYETLKGPYTRDITSELIQVAQPKKIENEWRVFMVDGKASTGSQYRYNHHLVKEAGLPERVVEFCEELDKIYRPNLVYTLDICTSSGIRKVVEVNGMNCSGFYLSDVEKLVEDISALF